MSGSSVVWECHHCAPGWSSHTSRCVPERQSQPCPPQKGRAPRLCVTLSPLTNVNLWGSTETPNHGNCWTRLFIFPPQPSSVCSLPLEGMAAHLPRVVAKLPELLVPLPGLVIPLLSHDPFPRPLVPLLGCHHLPSLFPTSPWWQSWDAALPNPLLTEGRHFPSLTPLAGLGAPPDPRQVPLAAREHAPAFPPTPKFTLNHKLIS